MTLSDLVFTVLMKCVCTSVCLYVSIGNDDIAISNVDAKVILLAEMVVKIHGLWFKNRFMDGLRITCIMWVKADSCV